MNTKHDTDDHYDDDHLNAGSSVDYSEVYNYSLDLCGNPQIARETAKEFFRSFLKFRQKEK